MESRSVELSYERPIPRTAHVIPNTAKGIASSSNWCRADMLLRAMSDYGIILVRSDDANAIAGVQP